MVAVAAIVVAMVAVATVVTAAARGGGADASPPPSPPPPPPRAYVGGCVCRYGVVWCAYMPTRHRFGGYTESHTSHIRVIRSIGRDVTVPRLTNQNPATFKLHG